ncbi:MAG: alpha-L-arabinofuranosidase C-terminal domain-containing protein [Candidatus Limiplasma sp.]|nr:alpha-L-arabinofuranosidase C-terminal domain-containing protein [Candidatus Limiplasma sp.]MEA5146665.1 alpha-L-arabinofuranosidase C-terminal domain-containing protein [Candidatus Limiplasma sp.]
MVIKLLSNAAYLRGTIDGRLFSSFLEHMGRVIYTGIYEPGHPTADDQGFRGDVLQAVRQMGVTAVRYPGGNFVSNYHWQDGVGPAAQRPRRVELAWRSVETNAFGLNEFMRWAAKAGAQPILTVNLGTQGIENALELLEYCNHDQGTFFSDLRRSHGIAQPYRVQTWCLGNEMDGHWQIGHKTAQEYARLAAETGRAMKRLDPDIQLVACGSSKSDMASHPAWDLEVLEQVYGIADYLALHQYYGGQEMGTASFLAQSLDMEAYFDTIRAAITVMRKKTRSQAPMYISLDEWGVWSKAEHSIGRAFERTPWNIAPVIDEQAYTMEDTLLFASMLLAVLKHADIVKIACQALLTNISACIMTTPDGGIWLQPIYYVFMMVARHAQGQVLHTVDVAMPHYACDAFDRVPVLDHVQTLREDGVEAVCFAVNRSQTETLTLQWQLEHLHPVKIEEFTVLSAPDKNMTNRSHPEAIRPCAGQGARLAGDTCQADVPPLSFCMLRVSLHNGGGQSDASV